MFIPTKTRFGKMNNTKAANASGVTRKALAKIHDAYASEIGENAANTPLAWEPHWKAPVRFNNFGECQEGELIAKACAADVKVALVAAKNSHGTTNLIFVENGFAVRHGDVASLALAASYDSHYGSNLVSGAKRSPFYGKLFKEFELV